MGRGNAIIEVYDKSGTKHIGYLQSLSYSKETYKITKDVKNAKVYSFSEYLIKALNWLNNIDTQHYYAYTAESIFKSKVNNSVRRG